MAPRVLEPLPADAADDPVVGARLRGIASILAVPIFHDGRPAEWVLLLRREPGWSDVDVRTAVQSTNLLNATVDARQAAIEVETLNERLSRSIDELARVQRSLLPDAPNHVPGLCAASYDRPCEAAGGDDFDHRSFDDGRVGVMIADVSGHGPAASVVMAMLRTAMTANRRHSLRPETVVEDVNHLLREAVGDGTFVTAFFLALDPGTGEATYANCGHPPPRVVRADGRVERLDADASIPLGIVDELEARGGTTQLEPGDRLVLSTDGIIEAFDEEGRMLGLEGLDRALAPDAGPRPSSPGGLVDRIVDAVAAHAGGRPADDDRCIVVVERTADR